MSKADTLGNSSAFGAARTARSSRRNAINNAIGGDEAANAAITELPLTLIGDNPDNPRDHLRNLDETVQTVREVGVLLPIVVATVDAYLRERPTRADDLDHGAQYLVVDGHRRLEAARRVGLATIPVRVDNARVATDESLLEAAFVANYHREDMTDLEEAHALQALVEYYGSQTKASRRLGIPQGTISSKLSLLKLSPELQKDLVTGARKVEHVRNLGKLTPTEQKSKADERAKDARRAIDTSTAQKADERSSSTPSPADYHAVITPRLPAGNPMPAPSVGAETQAKSDTAPVPDHDAEPSDLGQEPGKKRQVKMPWADGVASMDIIFAKLASPERRRAIGRYLEHLGTPEAFVEDLTAATSPEYRKHVAELLLRDV